MTRPLDAPDWMDERDFDIDLGDDHWVRLITEPGADKPTHAFVTHRCAKTESGWDAGSLPLHTNKDSNAPKWTVESWDPLTLSPSLLQRGCGDHGFIRGGKWVRA